MALLAVWGEHPIEPGPLSAHHETQVEVEEKAIYRVKAETGGLKPRFQKRLALRKSSRR
jgi:hypothetical protein